jgi:hypothetical protein
MEPADDATAPPAPDSWETADIDGSMSRFILSARHASSSPDLADDQDGPAAPPAQQQAPSAPAPCEDPVAQVDQFLREALEKPRERLSGITILMDFSFSFLLPIQLLDCAVYLRCSVVRRVKHPVPNY